MPKIIYTKFARIAHAWVTYHRGHALAPDGIRVTDDFGNSVPSDDGLLLHYLRQEH